MVRLPRAEVLDPRSVEVAHVYNRCIRRCFLMGGDALSGKNYDHRKIWIEQYLQQFAAAFGIDLLGFSILSNHFHLILRTRPDVVETWDDEEVARRWLMLCPFRRNVDGTAAEPSTPEINSIAGCPIKRAEIRNRLSDISWWMRLLCQRVAMRANREDNEHGRFFQDRYGVTKLTDEASLLACAAYVDLNPIRAAMCETLEGSDHTSVQRRIQDLQLAATENNGEDVGGYGLARRDSAKDDLADRNKAVAVSVDDDCSKADEVAALVMSGRANAPSGRKEIAAFLSRLSIDELNDDVGPCASESSSRCSDKGFLAMPLVDYLELLDWTARQRAGGKRGSTPAHIPPLLSRLGLDAGSWTELVSDFGKLFGQVAGMPEQVDAMRSSITGRRFHLRMRTRELLETMT